MSEVNACCVYTQLLIHSFFSKALSPAKQARFGKDRCDKMLKGRKQARVYIEFLLTFGDIYLEKKWKRGTKIHELICKGNKLCDLITTNMEALMRTVLYVGCSLDWPAYLNSSVYKKWAGTAEEEDLDNLVAEGTSEKDNADDDDSDEDAKNEESANRHKAQEKKKKNMEKEHTANDNGSKKDEGSEGDDVEESNSDKSSEEEEEKADDEDASEDEDDADDDDADDDDADEDDAGDDDAGDDDADEDAEEVGDNADDEAEEVDDDHEQKAKKGGKKKSKKTAKQDTMDIVNVDNEKPVSVLNFGCVLFCFYTHR